MIPQELLNDSNKFLISINGVDLSEYITEFSYNEYDISSSVSGLNDNGAMNLDIVAKDKRKLTIKWTECPSSYKTKIKNALSGITFNAKWVCGDDDESITVYSYRGDRTYTMKQLKTDKKPLWDVSVSVIGMEGE